MWPFILGATVVLGANKVESVFFPVVSEFHTASIERKDNTIVLSGFMHKTRDCQLIGVTASMVIQGRVTPLPLLYTSGVASEVGIQGWGPWRVVIPTEQTKGVISLSSTYRCHPLWSTQTNLISIPVGIK